MHSSEATARYVSIALTGQSWGFECRRIPKTLEAPSRKVFDRPARFQTSNFIGPYNLHRLLLSGLGLLFRSLPIVLLDQS